ncbi:type VI immunity family protein [Providencia manganoxydans]|uniref:type VI immunity family protein n=1 Tax=Providencia manganoxydans TaxID=2923283 RepID=UPI0034E3AD7C
MTLEEQKQFIEKQLSHFSLLNNGGMALTRLGITIIMIYPFGYTAEKKHNVLNCFRRFREEFGYELRLHTHGFSGLKKYTDENIQKFETKFLAGTDKDDLEWDVSDAFDLDTAPKYLMSMVTSLEASGHYNRSYLNLTLPWDYLFQEDGLAKFQGWFDFLKEQLSPDAGYCDFGVTLPRNYHEYQAQERVLAERYPLMTVNSTIHGDVRRFGTSVRSVNWITIISPYLLQCLGGIEWVRKKLSLYPEIQLTETKDSLVIQIGDYPILCDSLESVPESYYAVNDLLRPIRLVPDDSLHTRGYGHFDIPATKAWYSRLDRAPLKITPIVAGEPALVAGYYHTEKEGLKEAYFERGAITFDVNNNPEGTTLWHLVREGKRDN